MKKLLALILLLTMIAPISFADTDGQIMFHNIPWGIGIDKLAYNLKQRNIDVPSGKIKANANMAIWTYYFRNSYEYDIEATGHKIQLSYWGNTDAVKIAGYPVQEMELYAHYDITNDVLNLDAANSKYYMATVWFDISDEMAVGVYADLANKLTALYGNGKEATTNIIDTTYTYTVWNGANNTAVCLYKSISESSDYQFVHLMYGKTDCEQTLRKVRRLVIEHEIQSVANDSTGL